MIKWNKLLSRKDSEGQRINNTQWGKCYEYAIDNNLQDKYIIKMKTYTISKTCIWLDMSPRLIQNKGKQKIIGYLLKQTKGSILQMAFRFFCRYKIYYNLHNFSVSWWQRQIIMVIKIFLMTLQTIKETILGEGSYLAQKYFVKMNLIYFGERQVNGWISHKQIRCYCWKHLKNLLLEIHASSFSWLCSHVYPSRWLGNSLKLWLLYDND